MECVLFQSSREILYYKLNNDTFRANTELADETY